jgi:hypothetical protein
MATPEDGYLISIATSYTWAALGSQQPKIGAQQAPTRGELFLAAHNWTHGCWILAEAALWADWGQSDSVKQGDDERVK